MINYIELIANSYPNVGASCNGDPSNYEDIIWDNEIISKEELDINYVDFLKETKISELSLMARASIIIGFKSDALNPGYLRHYDGNIEDQLNIAGATMVSFGSEDAFLYPSRDIETMTKSYINHTPSQMIKVASDGASFKLNILKRFNDLRNHILSLNEVSEINSVNWDTQV